MTLTTPAPASVSTLSTSVPRLLGYVPSESIVLLPVRGGTPTGALRFSLTAIDPEHAARTFIGALGRFGRAEAAIAVLYTSRPLRPETDALLDALRDRAGRVGLGGLDVVVPGTTATVVGRGPDDRLTHDRPPRPETEDRPALPDVPHGYLRAVAASVDALLDRHPGAGLPEHARAGALAAVRRAASGRRDRPRAEALAALIVCVQTTAGVREILSLVPAVDGRAVDGTAELVSTAGVCAPCSERAAVLVVLAVLHDLAGRRSAAVAIAQWAVQSDPHDLSARRLAAALEAGRGSRWAALAAAAA